MGVCCQKEDARYELANEGFLVKSKNYTLNAFDDQPLMNSEIDQSILEGIPENAVHLRLYATYDEKQYPIWVDQGTRVKFYVRGKWKLYDGEREVSCLGDEQNTERIMNYPVGCLMGYVQGGSVFQVYDRSTVVSTHSGCLFLFQNNGQYETRPSGYLDVFVLGGKIYKHSEIEKLSGWSYSIVDTTGSADYLTAREKELVILINKLRHNPRMFAEKYLTHLVELSKAYEECYNLLFNLPARRLEMLKCDWKLQQVAAIHARDMGENGEVGHISSDQKDLSDRIKDQSLVSQSFGENCSYGKASPISIMLQLIVDDEADNSGHRENFFKEEFSHIGVSIGPHKLYEWNCVQTFAALEED